MKKRSPIAVFAFSFITIFIYSWYWLVKTKGEMNAKGEKIPTAFIWLIPIVGPIWWLWKYSEGVEHVTNKELSGILAFIVLWLLGPIGNAITQDYFNKISVSPAGNTASYVPPQQPADISLTPTPPAPTVPTPPLPPTPSDQPPSTPVIGG